MSKKKKGLINNRFLKIILYMIFNILQFGYISKLLQFQYISCVWNPLVEYSRLSEIFTPS